MRYCGCSVKNQVLEIAWLSLNRLSSSIFCCLSVSLLGTRNTQLNLHLFKYIQAYKPYFDPEEYLQVPTVITFWSIHWIFLWPIWWVTPSILRLVFWHSSNYTTITFSQWMSILRMIVSKEKSRRFIYCGKVFLGTVTQVKGADSFSIFTKALRVPAGLRVGLDIFTTDLETFLHHVDFQAIFLFVRKHLGACCKYLSVWGFSGSTFFFFI